MNNLDEEIYEFWVSATYTSKFFTKKDVDNFLKSLNDENGLPPKGTNVFLRHLKFKNPIAKAQVLDMSVEDVKLFIEMIQDEKIR